MLLALAAVIAPAPLAAQSYEVLHDGLYRLGNFWEFNTVGSGGAYRTTWQFVRAEPVGGRATLVLRETAGSRSSDDRNIVLDQNNWTVVASFETINTVVPPLHFVTVYSDPYETIPRVVNRTDAQRLFGVGEATTYMQEDATNRWDRVMSANVSWVSEQNVQVPAGTFYCIVFKVEEFWQFKTGEISLLTRTYYMSPVVGPVSIVSEQRTYNVFGQQTSYETATHQLRRFAATAPELFVDSFKIDPTSLWTGETVTINWRANCIYVDAPSSHVAEVYLSPDAEITTTDLRLISGVVVPPLAAGQTVDVERQAVIPPIPRGTYNVAVAWDVLNQVEEFYEKNVAIIGQIFVETKPDLAIVWGAYTPAYTEPGRTVRVRARITNGGGALAPMSNARIYLSLDDVITPADLPLYDGFILPAMGPMAVNEFFLDVNIPSYAPDGFYYLGVECDSGQIISEIHEDNNFFAIRPPIRVGLSDLAPTTGTFRPAGVQPGDPLRVEATIVNAGITTSPFNWVHLYLSTDTLVNARDPLLRNGLQAPPIAPGGRHVLSIETTVPMTTAFDSYYVAIACDVINEVRETTETNNLALLGSGRLIVTGPPDLRVADLQFAPQAVQPGEPITLAGFVVNATGAAANRTCWVEFFVSPNRDFSEPRRFLCQSAVLPPLEMGERFPLMRLPRMVSPDVPPGDYTVGIVVDRLNELPEANDANNTAWVADKRLYVGPGPAAARRWALYQ